MGSLSRLESAKGNSVRASRREASLFPLAKADEPSRKRDYEPPALIEGKPATATEKKSEPPH